MCMIFGLRHPDALNRTQGNQRIFWLAVKLLVIGTSLLATMRARAQQLPNPIGASVPHRYLVVYRDGTFPSVAESFLRVPGVQVVRRHQAFGIAVVESDPSADEAATIAGLLAHPNVEFVVHDRMLSSHSLLLRPVLPATFGITITPPPTSTPTPGLPYDTYYTPPRRTGPSSPAATARDIPGGPAHGPLGHHLWAGVRIAILDSGVDAMPPRHRPEPRPQPQSEVDQSPATSAQRLRRRHPARPAGSRHLDSVARSRPPSAQAPATSSESPPPPPCSTSK